MPESLLFISFIVIGLLTGLMSGLTGLGGGVVAVPLLIEVFHYAGMVPMREAQVAIGTSLSILIVNNFLTARNFHKANIIDWTIVRVMSPWMVLGGCIGPLLSSYFSSKMLSIIFAIFMFYVAFSIFLSKPTEKNIKPHLHLRLYAFGFGVLAGLMGIAGGAMVIPFLMRQGLLTREAAAASACITLPVVLVASVVYIFAGWQYTDLQAGSLGYIYLPAAASIALLCFFTVHIGTRLALNMSNELLRKIFASIILILAIQLLWSLI